MIRPAGSRRVYLWTRKPVCRGALHQLVGENFLCQIHQSALHLPRSCQSTVRYGNRQPELTSVSKTGLPTETAAAVPFLGVLHLTQVPVWFLNGPTNR